MKLTKIGIIVGAIIGLNVAHADDLPAPFPASEPATGVIEGVADLGIKSKVNAIQPLAMDNTAVWQMGSGDMANVTIMQNTSGVTNGHVALVDTHASYNSDVVVQQSGNLNEAEVELRYKHNDAWIKQDGLRNQAKIKVERWGQNNDLRVTQMGDNNISVVKALGGADFNEADVQVNGHSNVTYTEFSDRDADNNDVDINVTGDSNYVQSIVDTRNIGPARDNLVDIEISGDGNRVFTEQIGRESTAMVNLQSSSANEFLIHQTSYDAAYVSGNGAYGNVGLINQN
ncbi:curlin [Vibrio splendidus]|uniref:Curlin n=1 Tax=Vibrio lentus TaxID=136468 RepID=A0A4U2A5L8_9VIBR|nr:curlin [Vibrio lentus]PHN85177.1 curlin [Vibrio splendidus]MCC4785452.1 curlin [Vibrio lentus]MCC4857943.1 curlin [Vibrio lentus]OMO25277.1 curlin [Vibrio lentus]PME58652.1 curlin [Vibrio lentus]